MSRILQNTPASEIVATLRDAKGYYITNTARDLSQSDFKNRILLHTDMLAAPSAIGQVIFHSKLQAEPLCMLI